MKMIKKIAVIAGTSEATDFIRAVQQKYEITAFTATELGKSILEGLECSIKTGRLNEEQFRNELLNYDCIVDASHPFAEKVSDTVRNICRSQKIMYLRMGRNNEKYDYDRIIYVSDKSDVTEYLNIHRNLRILFTTGANTFQYYAENICDFKKRAYVRIINTEESLKKIKGYENNVISAMPPFTAEDTEKIIKDYKADILVSKDSGARGGLFEKISAVKKCSIPVILIESPEKNINTMNIEDIVSIIERN